VLRKVAADRLGVDKLVRMPDIDSKRMIIRVEQSIAGGRGHLPRSRSGGIYRKDTANKCQEIATKAIRHEEIANQIDVAERGIAVRPVRHTHDWICGAESHPPATGERRVH
jgi:hypothetical protein